MNRDQRYQALLELAEPICASHGVELVELRLLRGKRTTVDVVIDRERKDGKPGSDILVTDCTGVSRDLSSALDIHEDLIPGEFHLEVGSPGPERPLTKPEHFQRFTGFDVKIRTTESVQGKRTFRGTLVGLEGDEIVLEGDTRIPRELVERTVVVKAF